jgi:N-glycosylase/DNA lyase
MRSTLATPAGFSFQRTVLSHGWCTLPPFRVGEGGQRLDGVVSLPAGGAVAFTLRPRAGSVLLESAGKLDGVRRRQLVASARRVLNLDLDLDPFYERVRADASWRWIEREGAGRMLRAPTAFEDMVKLILTTNCSWSLTVRMVRSLVERCGEAAAGGARAFPGPQALARVGERALRERMKTGYRAPLLEKLAHLVQSARVDPASWEDARCGPDELRRRILELPGAGPYVAESYLKLIGRPAGLALDSWLRAKYGSVYHGGRAVSDRTIARRYAPLGPWAGLALWCEMTRDWFTNGKPSPAFEALL